ncbi:jg3739 [Pararge aegeria aegeria]|uniref:Jg3739 protein n=1 Tax=Pararge aegeria aegeria TaxID=348720 RepID=A0A8S4QIU9_9NEOP|nr:jg3739 [Pararge aegeria aegeria]
MFCLVPTPLPRALRDWSVQSNRFTIRSTLQTRPSAVEGSGGLSRTNEVPVEDWSHLLPHDPIQAAVKEQPTTSHGPTNLAIIWAETAGWCPVLARGVFPGHLLDSLQVLFSSPCPHLPFSPFWGCTILYGLTALRRGPTLSD